MKIEATASQVSDAINLATYKARMYGVNRKVVTQVELPNGGHIIKFADGTTLNTTHSEHGAYPYLKSIDRTAAVVEAETASKKK